MADLGGTEADSDDGDGDAVPFAILGTLGGSAGEGVLSGNGGGGDNAFADKLGDLGASGGGVEYGSGDSALSFKLGDLGANGGGVEYGSGGDNAVSFENFCVLGAATGGVDDDDDDNAVSYEMLGVPDTGDHGSAGGAIHAVSSQ